MASSIEKIDQFHKTRTGKFVFAAIELLIAFGFSVWAVDTGELWQHALVLIFFIGAIRNLFNALNVNDIRKHN